MDLMDLTDIITSCGGARNWRCRKRDPMDLKDIQAAGFGARNWR